MITINGKTYEGNNVQVINNKVIVDGKEVDDTEFKVIMKGKIKSIKTDRNVECDDVFGDVNAGGSVNCHDIMGDVKCGGSITCEFIEGDVSAGGSVTY